MKNIRADYSKIANQCGISRITARLLVNRGISCKNSIENFLHPEISKLYDTENMNDLKKAAEILKSKINLKSKIRIIGDYDVDGVASTYILYKSLKRCGADVDYDIPDRVKDGYGINERIIKKANDDGRDTILTCDNGIAAADSIKYAKSLGMTVIVTDHHDIPFTEDENGNRKFVLPDCDAVVDLKRDDCTYEFKDLCGAGVSFKLESEMYKEMGISKDECTEFIEIAALASVCDAVDIVSQNRIFVKYGLKLINNTKNVGLKALINQTGLNGKEITAYHLGFIIGPCINASGRLDTAKKGLKLLITDDEKEAEKLSLELHDLNEERKDMTEKGIEKAVQAIENSNIKDDKVFVIYIKDVHESIAGIVAGRIKERYNRPTIILTKSEDEVKGSGRSVEGYNMFEELIKCKDLLLKFGGHPMAAGMSLKEENVELLRNRLNKLTKLNEDDLIPKVVLDMRLPLDYITFDVINDLSMLEPFGKANLKPLFGDKNVNMIKGRIVGKNKNVLSLNMRTAKGKYVRGIYFGDIGEFEKTVCEKYSSSELDKLYKGLENDVCLDIAFYPSINEYNGSKYINIVIQELR